MAKITRKMSLRSMANAKHRAIGRFLQGTSEKPAQHISLSTNGLNSAVKLLSEEISKNEDCQKQSQNLLGRYFNELFPKADDWPNVGLDIWRRQTLVQSLAADLKNFYTQLIPDLPETENTLSIDAENFIFAESSPTQLIAQPNYLALAATDVFVEKAQLKLTRRARMNMIAGSIIALIALLTLAVGCCVIYLQNPVEHFAHLNGPTLTLAVMRATALSAFFLTAVVFMVGLARAFFHEGTILYNRRHAIRFGRLFVYINKGNVTLDALDKAFSWNSETATAFKDIKPDLFSKTVWHKVLESPAEILNALASLGKKSCKSEGKDKP